MSIREKIASFILGESIRNLKRETVFWKESAAKWKDLCYRFRDEAFEHAKINSELRAALEAIRNKRTPKASHAAKVMAGMAEDALNGGARS